MLPKIAGMAIFLIYVQSIIPVVADTLIKDPPRTVVKINNQHLRGTQLGKKIERYNKEIKELMAAARGFAKGSAPHKSVTEAAVKLRKERQALVRSRSRFVGLDFVLHGERAVQNRYAAVKFGLQDIIGNPYPLQARGTRIFHVWYSTEKGKWNFSELAPHLSDFSVFCANNVRATCYTARECVCADGSAPRRR